MKKIGYLIIAFMILSLCLAGLSMAGAEGTAGLEQDVLVLFTSDVHCGVNQNFTYAGLKAVKDAAGEAGNHVLLVDNGDSVQGEPIGILTTGMENIRLMNAMGYDVAIPGNHEFDYGMDRFFELVEAAEFPYISCNFRKNGETVFPSYILKEFDGVKIAFVGATTPETLVSSTPRYFQDDRGNYIYDFTQGNNGADFYAAVQKAADDARAEGASYVILLAHLGNEASASPYTYADVIGNTVGIDAVLDGHSHDTDKVVMKNRDGETVIRQACGTKLACIGWLRISAADGKVDTGLYTWNNDVNAQELFGIWNPVSARLFLSMNEINSQLSESFGSTAVALTIEDPSITDDAGRHVRLIRRTETNLGDLCADAVRMISGADAAVINGGNIRDNIPKGDITLNDLLTVFPFGNKIVVIEATGQQILDALEWGARVVPEENGGFLHVSGITYEIHTYIESGCEKDDFGMFTGISGERRVKNVTIGGEPLDPEKTYKLAGQDYTLLDHGDGHTAFDGAAVLSVSEELDYTFLTGYIRSLGGVVGEEYADPYGQGRIVAVAEAPAALPELPELPEGVQPVTWDVSPDHLMIETEEARELYERIVAEDYPSMEELRAHPVVAQLDALSAYYKALYGNTADIDTPERDQLRQEVLAWFLTLGSARTESISENGKHHYVYDGPLKREYKMELVLGLPASGKSTMIVDPDSEEMGAFVLDPDVIKAELPEYKESHGAGADAIHFEGMKVFNNALDAFLTGDLQGVNVILPIVGTDLDELLNTYIRPFEAAGYHVKVKFREAKTNEAAARVVMRELAGGQLINSRVAFDFGAGVEDVYLQLAEMAGPDGEPYVDSTDEELAPAA